MDEKKETSWNDTENLVTEVIRDNQKQSKRWFIAFLIALLALVGTNACWIYQWTAYDYVSQDGEGYNYYNQDVEGDITNGTTDQTEEK